MRNEAVIRVRLKTSSEGGRKTAITGSVYGCPLFVDGQGFDCRISLEGKTLELGGTYILSVKFMNPSAVLPLLHPGKEISLWEGKEIARGIVLSSD